MIIKLYKVKETIQQLSMSPYWKLTLLRVGNSMTDEAYWDEPIFISWKSLEFFINKILSNSLGVELLMIF